MKILPALNSENRFKLLEYFKETEGGVAYSTIKEELSFTDGNLVYHLNLLLSANLIRNTTEKTELGRHPHSFYEITALGKQVLETIAVT